MVEPDRAKARDIARTNVGPYFAIARHHQNNMRRFGFAEADFANGASDRLIDALVAGHTGRDPLEAIEKRVAEHLEAGADHVCLQVLTAGSGRIPLPEWRQLAAIAG